MSDITWDRNPRGGEPPIDSEKAKLEGNARLFRYDARLDPIADLMDAGDVEAWRKFHPLLVDHASIYRDFRTAYRAAVKAKAIPDDRGPSAA